MSRASALAKTIKAKPLDLPVLGSVLTLILSISPYVLKCSLNSSETRKIGIKKNIYSIFRTKMQDLVGNFLKVNTKREYLLSVVSQLKPPTNNFLQTNKQKPKF